MVKEKIDGEVWKLERRKEEKGRRKHYSKEI